MTPSGIFRFVTMALLGGVACGLSFPFHWWIVWGVSAIGWAGVPLLGFRRFFWLILVFICFFGSWQYAAETDARWRALPEKEVTLVRAEVIRMVVKERSEQATLMPIVCEGEGCPATRVIATVPLSSSLREGDILSLSCPLKRPEKRENFDYPMYLAKDHIGYVCSFPKEVIVVGRTENFWRRGLLSVRNWFESGIARSIAEPEAGLVAGLLIGGDDRLPESIQTAFSRVGLSHIVAVSGYNVSMIAVLVLAGGIAIGFYRGQAFWLALVGIALFTLIVGAPASAVRAAVMAATALIGMRLGRIGVPINAILLAATLMLVANPLLLRYDIGFQLSFAATIGLIAFPSLLSGYTFGEAFVTTLVAEAFVLPIVLFHFQQLPLLSLPANVLVLPLVPLVMLTGSIGIVLGTILPSLAVVFGFPAYLLAHTILAVVSFFASFSFASIEIPLGGSPLLFLWYGVVGGGIFLARRRSFERLHQ